MANYKFDKNFIFGGATAAYQVEGAVNTDGKGPCIWDEWYHRDESKFNADVACDFYNLFPLDLEMGKSIGMNGIRISIAWSRIFPKDNKTVNQKGIDYYHRVIDKCLELNIEPMVTLHHFDSPLWVVNQGDWMSKQSIEDFLKYASVCFDAFGSKVKKWATFNEPYVYNSDKYIYGESPPNEIGQVQKSIQSMHNMSVAHALVVNDYHKRQLKGKIGIVHVLQPKYPYNKKSLKDIESAHRATVLYSQFMLDANYLGAYSKDTLNIIHDLMSIYKSKLDYSAKEMQAIKQAKDKTDFLGINYYNPTWFKHYEGETIITHNGTGEKGTSQFLLKGLGFSKTPSHIKTTEWDWPIYSKGLLDIMIWVKKRYLNYKEIYITENGIGYKENLDKDNKVFDDYRIKYQKDHLRECLKAIHVNKIKVKGYYVWSWQDMFSWTNGFNKRYGLFFVDFNNQKRYFKLSAFWYKKVIDKKSLNISYKMLVDEYKKFKSQDFQIGRKQ
ncbi:MAG: 6-phospho-beta-galactosidase [Malacoplasma sp.]